MHEDEVDYVGFLKIVLLFAMVAVIDVGVITYEWCGYEHAPWHDRTAVIGTIFNR